MKQRLEEERAHRDACRHTVLGEPSGASDLSISINDTTRQPANLFNSKWPLPNSAVLYGSSDIQQTLPFILDC